jgi:DNA-binding NarL/FixJ family response regulator
MRLFWTWTEGLNGLLAAREISKSLPSVPILLHTVNNIPAVVAEAKKFGIRRVLGKGLDGDRLLNAIQEEVDARPRGVVALLEETTPQVSDVGASEAADGGEVNRSRQRIELSAIGRNIQHSTLGCR